MFSGIIQTVVSVHTIYEEADCKTYSMVFPKDFIVRIKIGASIANNGCCLTVIAIRNNLVSFNVINETLKLTNLNLLQIGDLVNIEEAMRYYDTIGGHLMTGHIDCTGKIRKIINLNKKNTIMWIKIKNKCFKKYVLPQGSIGIDGVSITINRVYNHHIRICLTPHTLQKTTLGIKKIGDIVNIEMDFMLKAVFNHVKEILLNVDYNR